MALFFRPTPVEEGSICNECRKGTYHKTKEHVERASLGKTLFTGFMKGATKQSASELGLAKATYVCSKCGHTVTI